MRTAIPTSAANAVRIRRSTPLAIWLAILVALVGVIPPASAQVASGEPPAAGAAPAAQHTIFLPVARRSGGQALSGLPFDPFSTRHGQATYYDADGSGNCSFDPSPGDLMVAAMNDTDYVNAWLCGAYVEITGPKGTVVVRIVDRCPECPSGNIDLSAEAFARIADPIDGRVNIAWHLVSPALSGPITYTFKDGSSKWWTAVQIRNHRNPIWRVEYRTSSGVFKEIPRQQYNYFVESSGMGDGPYTLRVTDIFGNVLTDTGIALVIGGEVAGKAQFPPMP